jgi:ADYC domain
MLWGAAALASPAPEAKSVPRLLLDGTKLVVVDADGRARTGRELVGARLVLQVAPGRQAQLRIDDVFLDPTDKSGETWLYRFMEQRRGTNAWTPTCNPDASGLRAGLPIAGTWTEDGRRLSGDGMTLTCTSGTMGKCVRAGYRYWKSHAGVPLLDHYLACTRAVRADYCGDGVPHTKEGTLIDISDRIGIQREEAVPGMRFEAAWSADGALCVAKTRLPGGDLEAIERACPARLRGRVGPAVCNVEALAGEGDALIFIRSR